jgi:NIMA (never in mitosis gene a)-related kinase
MAPEVCDNQKYDSKADVWSVGVILYELITLKKPFDGNNVKDLFKTIINQPLDPLPSNVDSNLQMLVGAMLNKNNMKRPDIFEVS